MTEAKYPDHLDPIERRIIDVAIQDILAAGHAISVYGDCELDLKQSSDYAEITDMVAACSQTEFKIFTQRPVGHSGAFVPRKIGWVMFVHGNGYHVLCDHTANDETEALLARANALAENLEERAHA